mmetsp:Transcript_12265/g.19317  ORF Transcript_12265/g.19317 Transcript_12265/m.19317 type:complete len:136 (-) Transcript_12265:367-774(-)
MATMNQSCNLHMRAGLGRGLRTMDGVPPRVSLLRVTEIVGPQPEQLGKDGRSNLSNRHEQVTPPLTCNPSDAPLATPSASANNSLLSDAAESCTICGPDQWVKGKSTAADRGVGSAVGRWGKLVLAEPPNTKLGQ